MSETHVNSIIGAGTLLEGTIKGAHFLRVDGDVIGTIEVSGEVVIGKNARCEGVLRAGKVTVGGVFRGEMEVRKGVHLLSTGVVMGTVRAPALRIDEGAVFHARCTVRPEAAQDGDAPVIHPSRAAG